MARAGAARTGSEFARQLVRELDAGLVRHYRVAVRAAAFKFLEVAVKRSPVKTGALRNNWQISTRDGDAPQVEDREGAAGTGPSTAQFQRADAATRDLRFGGIVYASNPMQYASYVDAGRPGVRARPMVRPALAAANAVLRANRRPPGPGRAGGGR